MSKLINITAQDLHFHLLESVPLAALLWCIYLAIGLIALTVRVLLWPPALLTAALLPAAAADTEQE